MIQDYADGGLKMVDIESYIHGLKATCVQRLTFSNSDQTEKWQTSSKERKAQAILRLYVFLTMKQVTASLSMAG